jgi:hypothetical protein
VVLLVAACACDAAPEPRRAPTVVSTSIDGDAPVSVTPELQVRLSAPVDPDTIDEGVFLVRGEPDPRLLGTRAPPLAARTGVLAVRARSDGNLLAITPRRALEPGARHTLVLGARLGAGGARLGRAAARAFHTGAAVDGAPVLTLVAPADGATGVVRNLRAVELRLSKPASGELALVGDDGLAVPARQSSDGDGAVRLELGAELAPERRYEVRAPSLRDADGRPPFGDPPGFTSGPSARTGPVALRDLAVETSDRCLVVRAATDEETRAELCVADRCVEDPPSRAHQLGLFVGDLPPPLGYRLRAWDETTLPPAVAHAVVDSPSPLMLSITEVLTSPLGPRPRQQFVELFNLGADAVELGGMTLHDEAGADVLPSARLASGAFALIVPSGFAPDGVDAPPDPAALVVRIADGRLGGNGLKIDGERVWLVDRDQRMVTAWGGWPLGLQAGQSAVRRSADACDLPASFLPRPGGGSSPGAW